MTVEPFGEWICDPSLPAFAPERCDAEMEYRALHCPCGSGAFRASGWPQVASGSGGYFWRTLTRVWREARLTTRDGEPLESPFALPLRLKCDFCGREAEIVAGEEWGPPEVPRGGAAPREAYRCRVCRRAVVDVVVGVAGPSAALESPRETRTETSSATSPATIPDTASGRRRDAVGGCAAEVIARCRACRREARIAWNDVRPSRQEVQLDSLYGRR